MSTLPASIVRFLQEDVVSAGTLTVLLALKRLTEHWWSADSLALELGLSIADTQQHLERLTRLNLLDVRIADAVRYRYHPGTDALARVVERVAAAHAERQELIMATLTGRMP